MKELVEPFSIIGWYSPSKTLLHPKCMEFLQDPDSTRSPQPIKPNDIPFNLRALPVDGQPMHPSLFGIPFTPYADDRDLSRIWANGCSEGLPTLALLIPYTNFF